MEHTTRSLGKVIKRLRKTKGLTADALARSVGITENAIRKIESGESKEPRFSTGLRMAAVLGVSPLQLTGGVNGRQVGSGPDLARVIKRIRGVRKRLEKFGVKHVSIFGSVARGDARSTSDIDVVVEPATGDQFSLIDLGSVDEVLAEALQSRVDVLTLGTIRSSRFAAEALRDAVVVF